MPDNGAMSRKARPHPKPKRQPTYLKAWRKDRELTLVEVCERLLNLKDYHLTDGQLSRIERGEQPYSQDLLEALAEIYKTEPASLIMRDPNALSLWSILDSLTPPQREQAVALIEVIKKTAA